MGSSHTNMPLWQQWVRAMHTPVIIVRGAHPCSTADAWFYDSRAGHVHFWGKPTAMQTWGIYLHLTWLGMHALAACVHEHASDGWWYGSGHTSMLKCHMHAYTHAHAPQTGLKFILCKAFKKCLLFLNWGENYDTLCCWLSHGWSMWT